MMAARPTNWASSAPANMTMKTGTTGVSANLGQTKTLRGRRRPSGARARPMPTKARPATQRQDGVDAEIALGEAGEQADGQQRQDVVDDGGAKDDPREGSVEHPHLGQHATGDADAGGRQREADEHRREHVLTDGQADDDAGDDGQDEADGADRDGHGADLEQVVDAHLQSDREEQDDDAQLGEDLGGER